MHTGHTPARPRYLAMVLVLLASLGTAIITCAQSIYRYQDEQGNWHFTDRKPDDEVDNLQHEKRRPGPPPPAVTLAQSVDGSDIVVTARNDIFCPVQLRFRVRDGARAWPGLPDPIFEVLQANSTTEILRLPLPDNRDVALNIEFGHLPGDPDARHQPSRPYRAQFAIESRYAITQAFPDEVTHNTAGSRHAVDLALPEGTPVYAAREGMVFEVAYGSFTGGTTEADRAKANLVRILHDDGTMAVYAHLAWNAIRVRPGTRVTRGERIASSGNTGFSSGPHLHFGVQKNSGGRMESVPVSFEGPGGTAVTPTTGAVLTAY
ncbi:MAG: M23 family metallopeptidase [Pseudomonadota bacterium]